MFLDSRFSSRFLPLAVCFSAPCAFCAAGGGGWEALAEPEVKNGWVRPAQGKAARPVWGHAEGLRVGFFVTLIFTVLHIITSHRVSASAEDM